MRLSNRLSSHVLALCMLCTTPYRAMAATDGDLCSGFAVLLCVPVLAAGTVLAPFQPKSLGSKVSTAMEAGDADKAICLLGKADQAQRNDVLGWIATNYLIQDDANNAVRLRVATYLLDEGKVDVSGYAGQELLQRIVSATPGYGLAVAGFHARQQTLAALAIAHGAPARGVFLGGCESCNMEPAFVALMLGAGADINNGSPGRPALFNHAVMTGDLAAAKQLIDLGADPNGRDARGGNVLNWIASGCDLRSQGHATTNATLAERCVTESLARARFTVAHGANPSGQPTPGWTGCRTPYEEAKRMQNTALADLLLQLGADPDAGAPCQANLKASQRR